MQAAVLAKLPLMSRPAFGEFRDWRQRANQSGASCCAPNQFWDTPHKGLIEFIKLALQLAEVLRFSLLLLPALRARLPLLDEL